MELLAVGYNADALWAYEALETWLAERGVAFKRCNPQSEAEVIQQAQSADIFLAFKYPITRKIMRALPQLRVVMSSSIGFDHIDVEAATELGIVVTNAPTHNVNDVAELTLALVLATGRKVVQHVDAVRRGAWRPVLQPINRVQGKTLGLIGFGKIAKATAWRANGIGMKVVAFSRSASSDDLAEYQVTPLSMSDLLAQSDFVSLHIVSNAATRHTLRREHFQQMKSSAYLINTGRGELVHEGDLLDALSNGEIAGAGLDVMIDEPPPTDHPLRNMNNVLITGHSAASTVEAAQDWVAEWKDILTQVFSGQMPTTCVNPKVTPRLPLSEMQL